MGRYTRQLCFPQRSVVPRMNMPVPMSSDTGSASSAPFAAEVDLEVFYELLASVKDTSPVILHIKKTWPTRHVYFLQHPAGLFFVADTDEQDFRHAQVINVKDLHFPFAFHF